MPFRSTSRAVATARSGRTSLRTLRSQVPLALRQTGPPGATDASLTIVASGFWPLGGDRADLEVVVESGARLSVGSAGAAIAQPGPSDPVSRQQVRLEVAEDAHLAWRPRPLVVGCGAEHRLDLTVSLEAGASLFLVETVVLGRGDEAPGRYRARWRVSYDGLPLLASDLDVGAGAPAGWDGPAVLGPARVIVTALIVGEDRPREGPLPGGGEVLALAGPGALISWIGSEVLQAPLQNAAVIAAFRAGNLAATWPT